MNMINDAPRYTGILENFFILVKSCDDIIAAWFISIKHKSWHSQNNSNLFYPAYEMLFGIKAHHCFSAFPLMLNVKFKLRRLPVHRRHSIADNTVEVALAAGNFIPADFISAGKYRLSFQNDRFNLQPGAG
ncbi:MAG: hypothetical protein GY874_21405 [Desulfobacteraceae bacterium]|nr:hypothetical protein [Desulfobacteraceae bacterium]